MRYLRLMFDNKWLTSCKNSRPQRLATPVSPISGVESGNSHHSYRNPAGNRDNVHHLCLCLCSCPCLCHACCNYLATHRSTFPEIQLLQHTVGTGTKEWWRCDLFHLGLRLAGHWSHAAKWYSWASQFWQRNFIVTIRHNSFMRFITPEAGNQSLFSTHWWIPSIASRPK